MVGKRGSVENRFWSKVDRNGPVPSHRPELGPCWVWTASRYSKGYGQIWTGTRREGTHRVSYRLAYGDFSDDWCVLHRCDNPPCVRPSHLFLGTLIDNNADMAAKGRRVSAVHPEGIFRGERNPSAKLNGDLVRTMRAMHGDGLTMWKIAKALDLNYGTVKGAVRRKTWRHIP